MIGNNALDHPVLRRIGGTPADTAMLFSYGTLQQPGVQLATFGRRLTGAADQLPAHRGGWITITDPAVIAESGSDRHPIVRATSSPADTVTGTVLTLSTAELAASDACEVDDYRRSRITLASGTRAWVYRAAGQPAVS
ncbi:MAG TPA: gamma-glutamylcyclotransferase family protein [Streptosporangiaceae bacterium]